MRINKPTYAITAQEQTLSTNTAAWWTKARTRFVDAMRWYGPRFTAALMILAAVHLLVAVTS